MRSVLALLLAAASVAHADEPQVATLRPHALYVELFGKGGLYGVGYDYRFARAFAAGGTLSFQPVEGQYVLTVSPYLGWYALGRRRSALLVQAGLQLVHVSIPSGVPGWPGHSATDAGGQVSVGYEYRSRVLVRLLFTSVVGRGGYAPWGGVSLGGAF